MRHTSLIRLCGAALIITQLTSCTLANNLMGTAGRMLGSVTRTLSENDSKRPQYDLRDPNRQTPTQAKPQAQQQVAAVSQR
jgi:hypothetical protein